MKSWVLREHQARSIDDLKQYCYVVAGIVGELLTGLFCAFDPELGARKDELVALSPTFGEGLQLVNVLKDRETDVRAGRHLVPRDASLGDLFALARRDLDEADRYVEIVTTRDRGIAAFCTLPLRLARATLDRLEQQGPGAKLTREEVATILANL